MGLNATIALDKKLHFCETGNRLALEYLKISRDVLNDVEADESVDYMKCRITNSFDALINHTCRCPNCRITEQESERAKSLSRRRPLPVRFSKIRFGNRITASSCRN